MFSAFGGLDLALAFSGQPKLLFHLWQWACGGRVRRVFETQVAGYNALDGVSRARFVGFLGAFEEDEGVSKMAAKEMSVREAGRKGGETTKKRHGPKFYQEIGRKGGQKVKRLIERGKKAGAQ
jgi:general stress protein YciG